MSKIIIDKNRFSKIKTEIKSIYSTENTVFLGSRVQIFLLFLLLNISDVNYTHRGIEIKKGQVFTSKKEIHEELKISYRYLSNLLESLSTQKFISYNEILLHKSNYLLVTVINCDCYKIEFEEQNAKL